MPKRIVRTPGNGTLPVYFQKRADNFDEARADGDGTLTADSRVYTAGINTYTGYFDTAADGQQYIIQRSHIRYDFRAGFNQAGTNASPETTISTTDHPAGKIKILKAFFVANDVYTTMQPGGAFPYSYESYITGSDLIPDGAKGSLIYVQTQGVIGTTSVTHLANYDLYWWDDATLSGPTFIYGGISEEDADGRIIPLNNRLLLKDLETAINQKTWIRIGFRDAYDVQGSDPVTAANTGSMTLKQIQTIFDPPDHRYTQASAYEDEPLELHIIYKVYSPASKLGRSAFSGGDIKSTGGSGFGDI